MEAQNERNVGASAMIYRVPEQYELAAIIAAVTVILIIVFAAVWNERKKP